MNFVEGRTKMEDLLSKNEQIREKAASIVVETIKGSSMKKRGLEQASTDIANLLEGFSDSDKASILILAISMMAINSSESNTASDGQRSNGLFSGRSKSGSW